jgi:hypothetical protein
MISSNQMVSFFPGSIPVEYYTTPVKENPPGIIYPADALIRHETAQATRAASGSHNALNPG